MKIIQEKMPMNLLKNSEKIEMNKAMRIKKMNINPLALPSAGAPALKYGDVNTETTSPGEVKGLIIIQVEI